MKTLYLCGAGNSEGVRLALRVNEAENRWTRLVILDDDPAKLGKSMLGIEIAGPISMLADADPTSSEVASLIARLTKGRAAVRKRIETFGIPFATIIHPSVDRLGTEIGEDVLVYENSVVSPDVTLGAGSVVFMRSVVGHESNVGRGCVLAAGSVLNARVVLEDEVYVGTNASILPEITVGHGATIGSNTLVIQDVPAGATVIGVPGTVLETAPPAERGESGHGAPHPRIEGAILAIWREALQRPDLTPDENFFDAGGSSLLALRTLPRIRAATGCELTATDPFRFPSVRRLAAHVTSELQAVDSGARQDRGRLRRLLATRRRKARLAAGQ